MFSILIPAYNEALSIVPTIQQTRAVMDQMGVPYEIIVIDDGSEDGTGEQAQGAGVRVILHPTNGGYGRALKTGMEYAIYSWCAILDADSSYPIEQLPSLLAYVPQFDMVVGARTGPHFAGRLSKRVGRIILHQLVRFVIGRKIPDVNSGFRVFRKEIAQKHSRLISSGFSFTTTLTLAMFLEGYFVKYVPIEYHQRAGKSKVRYGRDILRMIQILTTAVLYYNPLKLFLLLCGATVLVGAVLALIGLLFSPALAFTLFALSILVAFLMGGIGFLSEMVRLAKL